MRSHIYQDVVSHLCKQGLPARGFFINGVLAISVTRGDGQEFVLMLKEGSSAFWFVEPVGGGLFEAHRTTLKLLIERWTPLVDAALRLGAPYPL